MALILNVETATKNCAVALALNGEVLAEMQEHDEKYVHAEKLHTFIAACCKYAGKNIAELDAVAVSNGPGSYTGLRIGVSAAKGLCFALNIPLIAINTTEVLAQSAQLSGKTKDILAVIDARRNEVYAQQFDALKKPIGDIEAVQVSPESWPNLDDNALIVGDAAEKTANLLQRTVEINQCLPQATAMCALSERLFQEKKFVDVAYHEPFYLKDFIAGKPRQLL